MQRVHAGSPIASASPVKNCISVMDTVICSPGLTSPLMISMHTSKLSIPTFSTTVYSGSTKPIIPVIGERVREEEKRKRGKMEWGKDRMGEGGNGGKMEWGKEGMGERRNGGRREWGKDGMGEGGNGGKMEWGKEGMGERRNGGRREEREERREGKREGEREGRGKGWREN